MNKHLEPIPADLIAKLLETAAQELDRVAIKRSRRTLDPRNAALADFVKRNCAGSEVCRPH